MALPLVTANVENVQSLADKPVGTPAELKKKFDDDSINLKIDFNTNIIPEIETQLGEKATKTGWEEITAILTYASADSPTFIINTSSDLTGIISVGMKLKLTQTTVKYFIVTAKTSGAITVYGGTDYTLTNATITNTYFSMQRVPYGFPIDPDKWTVKFIKTDNTIVASPNTTTWYMGSTYNLDIPIGLWNLGYSITFQVTTSAQVYSFISLSTSSSAVSDIDFNFGVALPCTNTFNIFSGKNKVVGLTSKTKYYAIFKNDTSYTNLYFVGGGAISAVCAYL